MRPTSSIHTPLSSRNYRIHLERMAQKVHSEKMWIVDPLHALELACSMERVTDCCTPNGRAKVLDAPIKHAIIHFSQYAAENVSDCFRVDLQVHWHGPHMVTQMTQLTRFVTLPLAGSPSADLQRRTAGMASICSISAASPSAHAARVRRLPQC